METTKSSAKIESSLLLTTGVERWDYISLLSQQLVLQNAAV
jgi:hypothetical protein